MKEISGSSHFRSALKKLKQQYGKAGTLADASDIPRSVISRALSGASRPGLKTLHKLVDVLPVEQGAEVVAAYLTDQIPPKLNQHLCVCVRKEQGDCQCWEPFVQKMLSLPFEKRLLMEGLVDLLLNPNSPPSGRSATGELLPPGSRDHTQAQGDNPLQKIARFPLIPLLATFLAFFSISADCEHSFHFMHACCPECNNPILCAEICKEHKQL